jgi:hypothetical protein
MLTEVILKRWRALGLVADIPSALEREMAHEAAVALRILQDSERVFEISWRFVFCFIALSAFVIWCMFHFLM